ncbi:MAG: GvpL/GvpF family gas vesicle protein [Gemmatimonadaceae bacterium]
MAEAIFYVYGVVPAALDPAGAPPGIEGSPVTVEREGALAALLSCLDAEELDTERIEARVGEVGWVGPRAIAHDAVLTWASDAGSVVPLPMFALFSDVAAVRAMLRERADELSRLLARVAAGQEYALRIFRLDDVLKGRMAELSPRVAELESAAQSASPGQRYLLERKADAARSAELREVSARVAGETHAALSQVALLAATEPVATIDGGLAASVAVLNAFFLVARDDEQSFRSAVTDLASTHEPLGFRFDFTGPWPPYHFVRDPS